MKLNYHDTPHNNDTDVIMIYSIIMKLMYHDTPHNNETDVS